MKKPTRAASPRKAKTAAGSATRKRRAAASSSARTSARQKATNAAIATELAPAVAIALLDKTVQVPGAPAPALDVLGAGVSESEDKGKVRVQLVFENGSVLPVEMSVAAGAALSTGLSKELPADKKAESKSRGRRPVSALAGKKKALSR
jgi:hypothetical protein